jgi:hypothetical protein
MNNYLESLWKETVVAQFKVLLLHLFEGTRENHKNPKKLVLEI